MKKGLILFHRGFTDQIAMMSVVDYYKTKYEHLTILNVPGAKPLYTFYLNNKPNITTVYSQEYERNDVNPINIKCYNSEEYDYLFHGKHDIHRLDMYKNAYTSVPWQSEKSPHFGKRYYEFYGIPFKYKIEFFNFERNMDMENKKYKEFINKHGENYILYHEDKTNDHVRILKNLQKNPNINYINLHGMISDCFSMIKILEHAKELHLKDSAWAQFCYLLNARYNLFKNVKIHLYPFNIKNRWGGLVKDLSCKDELNLEPVSLNNWIIVT